MPFPFGDDEPARKADAGADARPGDAQDAQDAQDAGADARATELHGLPVTYWDTGEGNVGSLEITACNWKAVAPDGTVTQAAMCVSPNPDGGEKVYEDTLLSINGNAPLFYCVSLCPTN